LCGCPACSTVAEKQLVRDHFDEINERLAAQGHRTISLTDPEHVERYGLERLAKKRNVELEFELESEGSVGLDGGVGFEGGVGDESGIR
jgi:hypothetical protein